MAIFALMFDYYFLRFFYSDSSSEPFHILKGVCACPTSEKLY